MAETMIGGGPSDSDIVAKPDGPGASKRIPFGTRIATSIRDQISAGKLRAGDELPAEAELAERFGVSQRVVRDALRALNSEGTIATRQGKRAVVREPQPIAVGNYMRFLLDADANAIEELMDLRALLEGRAARLSAERATPPEVAAMRRAIRTIAEAGDDPGIRVTVDLDLHDLIARVCGNRFIHSMLTAMAGVLAEERRRGAEITQSSGIDHLENDAQHAALVEAIANGEGELAEKHAVEIVTRARDYLQQSKGVAEQREDSDLGPSPLQWVPDLVKPTRSR
ncbi:FadR/GntR family transcriptional regulator [Dactylosporangium sp. CA-233914]|uniref:FadR/GntR family transcriptional regulator n=1 Tax=Dactylosporangium sp. CA-233914 TaxID=3239934 RepID=UPI003D8C3894